VHPSTEEGSPLITYADADFHDRDPGDLTWTETTFLPVSIPEAGLFGNVYVLARPNLGVAMSTITMAKGFYTQPYQMDFVDPQMHLRCPEKFSDYRLGNGLSVTADGPTSYHLRYESKVGAAAFDLTFAAVHEPFDPHDPGQNPLLEREKRGPRDARSGDEWETGHFEVKGHVTGWVRLRADTFSADYYEGMDHSWGPRTEVGTRSVSWISVNFGEDLALHLAVPMRIVHGQVQYDPLRFGFVAEDGKVYGLVSAEVHAKRVDMMPLANHIVATDTRGKTYEFTGAVIAGHPHYNFNPCHTCFQSLFRYQHGSRVGYGEMGDIFGLEYLAEHLATTGTKRWTPPQ
jgi:hypothetical protein